MKTRKEELMAELKSSFSKDSYYRSELEPEMFTFVNKLLEILYNDNPVAIVHLKAWDIIKRLEQLNEECGHIADEQLAGFTEETKILCNLINAQVSGNAGEAKASRKLERLQSPNKVIKNVELGEGEEHTELDAVVITPKGVTIVEVKNPKKNIFIDEDGNYYRTGEYSRWDCNIAEKMARRERLLRRILENAGYGQLRIRSLLVFTNDRIEVHNKHAQIENCFLSQLTYMIDDDRAEEILFEEDMEIIQKAVNNARCSKAYPFEFDVQQYKEDFAELMVTLEFAKAGEESAVEETAVEGRAEATEGKKESFTDMVKVLMASKMFRYVSGAAAALAVTVVSGVVVENVFRGKGGL